MRFFSSTRQRGAFSTVKSAGGSTGKGGSDFSGLGKHRKHNLIVRLGGSPFRAEGGPRGPISGGRGILGPLCRPACLPWQKWPRPESLVYSHSYALYTKRAAHSGWPFWYETMSFFMAADLGFEPRQTESESSGTLITPSQRLPFIATRNPCISTL